MAKKNVVVLVPPHVIMATYSVLQHSRQALSNLIQLVNMYWIRIIQIIDLFMQGEQRNS